MLVFRLKKSSLQIQQHTLDVNFSSIEISKSKLQDQSQTEIEYVKS